jgi:hypothetical protein
MLSRTPVGGYRSKRTLQARTAPVPAVSGGWNRRDSVAAMPENDAIILDNMIPTSRGVVLRKGYAEHATGVTGDYVETLMVYAPASGAQEMFACGPSSIMDVTTAGAASNAVTGLSNGRWSWVNVSTLGGNYLLCANGLNAMRTYDGANWTSTSITGVTSSDIDFLAVHQNRIWMIEKTSMSVWYLAVGAVSGTATEFDLGPVARLGGSLVAMASWTRDGGAGMDDVAVFVTSAGEAIIYSGTDPSSATTWQLVGVFRIPEPLGRNCAVKIGADLGIITTQGVVSLNSVLPVSASNQTRTAITDKVREAYAEIVATSRDVHGWQVIEAPEEQLLLVNVPKAERVEAYQYVMNTTTGAWCRFVGLNAGCWAYFNNALYFGGHDGNVYKYTGTRDNSSTAIDGLIQHAFSAMRTPNTKIFDRVKPVVFGPSNYIPAVDIRLDYDDSLVDLTATTYNTIGPIWDEVYWDEEFWAEDQAASVSWQPLRGEGMACSLVVALASKEEVTYHGAIITFRAGGPY